jgi:hypothetical protein
MMFSQEDFTPSFMGPPPFPLYVDEVSPDNIKAVVSDGYSARYNIVLIKMALFVSPWIPLEGYINGILVIAAGKYVCIHMRATDKQRSNGGMILLDLKGNQEMAERMSEQFNDEELRNTFMEAFEEVMYFPENHGRFKLVVGKPKVYGRKH